MTTVAEVQADMRARIEAGFTAAALRFKNEDPVAPNPAAGFVYVELIVETPRIAGYGGGRGGNLQRTRGRIEAHVLVPTGEGVGQAFGWAETICAIFRGLRLAGVSYVGEQGELAEVFPVDGKTEDGTFAHVCTAIIPLFFDKAA